MPHGFADHGRSTTPSCWSCRARPARIAWVPRTVGVFPFYCTDFCSALHQEMQGYVRVSPRGGSVALVANKPASK